MTFRLPDGVVTPALVVDVGVLDRNIARMAEAGRAGSFALRPHAKTHKCPQIAERQLHSGAPGLTLATTAEAEVFAGAGVADLFIAYPLWVDEVKGRRLRGLADRVALRVGVDSAEGAERLGRAVRGSTRPVEALVEVDSGHHRTGVQPGNAADVAKAAAGAGLEVAGVFTFPGHGYDGSGAREQAARDEERALGEAARALEGIGMSARVVSGGSTPTAGRWRPGVVNELRPGVYVFGDATQLALGSCGKDDLALVAAATVVSVPAADRFVLDAGGKVLGADRQAWASGYGFVPEYPDATITALSEHHATVQLPAGAKPPRLGTVLAVVPNHVCATVNLADAFLVVKDGELVDSWPVAARGANT